jgi:hypothetical protein
MRDCRPKAVRDGAAGCPSATEQDDHYCRRMLKTMAVVGPLSMLAASAIDAAVLSWEPEVRQQKLAPVLVWDGTRGGIAGLAEDAYAKQQADM